MKENVSNNLHQLEGVEEAILKTIAYHSPNGITPVQIQKEVPIYTMAPVQLPTIVEKLERLKNIGYTQVEHGTNAWTLTKKGCFEALPVLS